MLEALIKRIIEEYDCPEIYLSKVEDNLAAFICIGNSALHSMANQIITMKGSWSKRCKYQNPFQLKVSSKKSRFLSFQESGFFC